MGGLVDSWPSGSAQPGPGENVEQGVEVALVGGACLAVRLSDGSGGDGAGFVGDEGLRGHGGWVAYETKILWIGSHVGLWWTVGRLAIRRRRLDSMAARPPCLTFSHLGIFHARANPPRCEKARRHHSKQSGHLGQGGGWPKDRAPLGLFWCA